jgi:hypothetical protein
MPKIKDLTGNKYNMLTAIKFIRINQNHRAMWLFKCDCGNEKELSAYDVQKGTFKNCGCVQTIKSRQDLAGNKYGRLTVISFFTKKHRINYWNCQCECGKLVVVSMYKLLSGHTKSCGCLAKENNQNLIHGLSKTRLYNTWKNMISRCENRKDKHYNNYGGRGIRVCKEWHDVTVFCNWATKNGYKENLTIDRISNNGNYEPSNCQWITIKEQESNRLDNKFIEYQGERLTYTEWSRRLGGSDSLVHNRIKNGLDEISAITTPIKKFKRDTEMITPKNDVVIYRNNNLGDYDRAGK